MGVSDYSLEETEERPRCPECGSTKMITDSGRGEIVCGSCGLVLEDRLLDEGPEWRAFDSEQRKRRERTGMPERWDYHDKGLSTVIDNSNRDASGRRLNPAERARAFRLRKWDRRSKMGHSKDRNMAQAFTKISNLAGRMKIPKRVAAVASVLYRQIIEDGYPRGRAIDHVAAAVLYYACRKQGVPSTLTVFEDASGVPEKTLGRAYKKVCHLLHERPPPETPLDHVPTIASSLGLSGATQQKTIDFLREYFTNSGLCSGRRPIGVAAAGTYLISNIEGEKKTQKEVSKASGVTEVTIRNRYKDMVEYVNDNLGMFENILGRSKLNALAEVV